MATLCYKCKKEVPDWQAHCPNCGTKFPAWKCRSCGAIVPADSSRCLSGAHPLSKDEAPLDSFRPW